jgi:hypothetical protein
MSTGSACSSPLAREAQDPPDCLGAIQRRALDDLEALDH